MRSATARISHFGVEVAPPNARRAAFRLNHAGSSARLLTTWLRGLARAATPQEHAAVGGFAACDEDHGIESRGEGPSIAVSQVGGPAGRSCRRPARARDRPNRRRISAPAPRTARCSASSGREESRPARRSRWAPRSAGPLDDYASGRRPVPEPTTSAWPRCRITTCPPASPHSPAWSSTNPLLSRATPACTSITSMPHARARHRSAGGLPVARDEEGLRPAAAAGRVHTLRKPHAFEARVHPMRLLDRMSPSEKTVPPPRGPVRPP